MYSSQNVIKLGSLWKKKKVMYCRLSGWTVSLAESAVLSGVCGDENTYYLLLI